VSNVALNTNNSNCNPYTEQISVLSFNTCSVLFQVAISCMDNQLLKYSAKDHFFKAALCHLCVDLLNGQQAVQKYTEMFPQFADARECKLVKVIHYIDKISYWACFT